MMNLEVIALNRPLLTGMVKYLSPNLILKCPVNHKIVRVEGKGLLIF
jgi:hypothetical protein